MVIMTFLLIIYMYLNLTALRRLFSDCHGRVKNALVNRIIQPNAINRNFE